MASTISRGRIALVAAGVLLGIAALILMARGFRGAAALPDAAAPEGRAPEGRVSEGRGDEKEPPPRWQSFLRPGEKGKPARPAVRFARGVSDPFDRPQGGAPRPVAAGNPGFRLQGISTGARAMALISGRAVREGDSLSGYRVVRIARSAVTLAGPQGRLDLALRAPGAGR